MLQESMDIAPAIAPLTPVGRGMAQLDRQNLIRWLLLGLILLAFARVCWRLDAKNMWWDESISLQRSESAWLDILTGRLVMYDGYSELPTIDQHPFSFFLLQGLLIRLAGESEFTLRYLSVLAATAFVPSLWALARFFTRQGVFPPATATWVALLAAINPFLLWYGQEARPYAMWTFLAVFSTYLLLISTGGASGVSADDAPSESANYRALYVLGYGVVVVLYLTTHFYAMFLLPVHALILYLRLAGRGRDIALLAATVLLALGLTIAAIAGWLILSLAGGAHYPTLTLDIFIPDLLNAFTMGLSVNINTVWWVDLLCAALLLLGMGWGLRSRGSLAHGGWLPPLLVITPAALMFMISSIRPAYMNARHLSLLDGGIVMLVGAGLAVLSRWQRWVAVLVALMIVAGAGYSSYNYFTSPLYSKDDYRALGDHLAANLLPGDVVLINPAWSWRIFDYYLPLDKIDAAAQAGVPVAHYGSPLLKTGWNETYAQLAMYRQQYRRIWLASSGTHPYPDPLRQVKGWLDGNTLLVQKNSFHSSDSFLDLDLYLTQLPVQAGTPTTMTHPLDVTFGDQIRLLGYDLGQPYTAGGALPVTLYWQTTQKTEQQYKYILQMVAPNAAGVPQVLALTERQPYDGIVPTNLWEPGKTIMEYSWLSPVDFSGQPTRPVQLTLQVYRADTLEKAPITAAPTTAVRNDEMTLVLLQSTTGQLLVRQ